MMTLEQGASIYKACKHLKINYSTGKSILKQFKKRGKLFKRKLERKEDEQDDDIE